MILQPNRDGKATYKVVGFCVILDWWTKRNTIRTIFHFPTCFCAINSNENSTLILFDSFCTTNYAIICALLQIIINAVISLDKRCTMCYNIITETGKNPKTKKKRK
nr:MAG TPA: hypothetical protein [Caudoviricetes sp.]